MTELLDPEPAALLASEAHNIAARLEHLDESQRGSRSLAVALLISGLINLVVLVSLVVLIQPVLRTARTVEAVAGPKAVAAQSAAAEQTLTLVLCKQRENTSESRELDGKAPLPLKPGCPPYNYAAPYLAPTTTTSPTPAKHRAPATTTATTERPTSTSPVTATTVRAKPPGCPTLTVVSTCLTVPALPRMP